MKPNRPSITHRPLPLTAVNIEDEFWGPRLRVNSTRTVPAIYRHCKETGHVGAFALDWKPGVEPKPHFFWDSDFAKWIEGACYSLATHPNPELEALLDEVVKSVVSAQQPDGYLNTYFTVVEPEKRWSNLRDYHELYCAGHLIEAGVAYFQATGKRTLLDAVCRYADYIGETFGVEPGKRRGYCGHEEIELALIKLYRATHNERYLRLSEYFVRERGRQPYYFDLEAEARGEPPDMNHAGRYEYCQAHRPVVEQTEVVGHAVRAMYLYSAMADLAGELGDPALLSACEKLWDDLCLKKLYITGGIGPSSHNEGFTRGFDLPNDTAYAETCAAIGLALWNHRLLQLDCNSRYADMLEKALYNGAISGVSLDGERFFYTNPLAGNGDHHRVPWFGCACCPTNIVRFVASLGNFIYGQGADSLAVHLYVQGAAQTSLADGTEVRLSQQTRYPWEGRVRISIDPSRPAEFCLRLRIPGWCRQYGIKLNGEQIQPPVEKGYAILRRQWKPGDTIELDFQMPVERMAAHPNVSSDQGRVALQRGPLVYCLEGVDHDVNVRHLILPDTAKLEAHFEPELLGGMVVIEGEAAAPRDELWNSLLYTRSDQAATRPVRLKAIPYFAWDNRAAGEMTVWLPRS